MYLLDSVDAVIQERAREATRINREGWKFEAFVRCREAGRRVRFRRSRDAASSNC